MSTAALLGLETSKSYQSLNNITKSLDELFKIRAKDQKSEELFYKESAKTAKREKADRERFGQTNIKTARDYEKAIKDAESGGGQDNALLMGGALLAAALLGTTGAFKGKGEKLFNRSSDFVKEFKEKFEQETEKIEKQGGAPTTSTPTTSTPTSTPTRRPSPKAKPEFRKSRGGGNKTKNEQAILKAISKAEGTPSYGTMFGGKVNQQLASGQLTVRQAHDAGMRNPGSGATGKYQFMPATIRDLVKWGVWKWDQKLTPTLQDKGALYLVEKKRKVNLKDGLSFAEIQSLSWEWASIKGNNYTYNGRAQGYVGQKDFMQDYQKFGGVQQKQKGGNVYKKKNGAKSEDRLAKSLQINPKLSHTKVQKKQKGGKIFLHWTATPHNSIPSGFYHTVFDGAGNPNYQQSYEKFRTRKGHTWRRNHEGVGLSLASMAGPNHDPWQKDPPTDKQIHAMAKEIALIAKKWKWSKQDINTANVMTHAEVAKIDNYFGERWDLLQLKKGDPDWSGGHKLRALAKQYFDGTATEEPQSQNTPTPKAQQPGTSAPDVVPLEEGREEVMDEQDKDERVKVETTKTTKSSIAEEFAQFGKFGQAALEVFRGIQKAAGFNLFGDLEDKTEKQVEYIDAPQDNTTSSITPTPDDTGVPVQETTEETEDPKKTEKENEKEQKKEAKKIEKVLKGIKKANHPDTGPGYQIAGMIDYKKRPVILSKAAAYNLAKAIDGGTSFKGFDVSSSQRSRTKNSSVGGHPNSTHLYGEGLDLVGSSMRSLKSKGPKFGWHYGYNHGPNSAHFNYKGPKKLQAGGIVGMQSGGTLADHFNKQHGPSMIENKYSRPIVVVKRRASMPAPADGGGKMSDDGYTGNRMSNQSVSTSMYKVQMGALI